VPLERRPIALPSDAAPDVVLPHFPRRTGIRFRREILWCITRRTCGESSEKAGIAASKLRPSGVAMV